MSWSDLAGNGPVTRRASAVDSARFGVSVDRVLVPAGGGDPLPAVLQSEADVVIVRFPASATGVFAQLLQPSHHVIHADTLMYWHLQVGQGQRPDPRKGLTSRTSSGSTNSIRPETVDALVADVFAGYGNHYSANPLFAGDKILAGYQEWARHAVTTGTVVVLSESDEDVAFATLSLDDSDVEIELAGVGATRQGTGIYPHLLAAVESEAIERSGVQILYSTQAHNTIAQRALARFGFLPLQTFTTVHVVRQDL